MFVNVVLNLCLGCLGLFNLARSVFNISKLIYRQNVKKIVRILDHIPCSICSIFKDEIDPYLTKDSCAFCNKPFESRLKALFHIASFHSVVEQFLPKKFHMKYALYIGFI